MNSSINVQEIAIVVAVRQQDPTLVNPEFLHYSGIIPEAWELAAQPIRSAQTSQIRFKNGVVIMAYPQKTIFVEPFRNPESGEQLVPGIALRYTEILRNLELQALGLNLQGFVPFNQSADAARNYLSQHLLANGPWQQLGTAPVQAQLNFNYQFERNRLHLSVQEAALQLPEQQHVPIVMFSGNFENDLRSVPGTERLAHFQQLLKTWPQDLAIYQEVVSQFLSNVPASPVPTASDEIHVTDAQTTDPVLLEV